LTLHWVRIRRGTNSLNRLEPDKIQVSQPGPGANELLFSAEKSAVLMLEDVRVGDIIDYAYSVLGDNPVAAGHFSGRVEMQSGHPIDRLTTRLLWPADKRLYVQNHGTDIQYSAVREGDVVEFTWNLWNVPGWPVEPFLPAWYQPFPWVQLSEFQKWSDVNQFALDLFTNTAPLSPELTRAINEWKRLPGLEQRVLAALRFVQDEIENRAIGSGASGYKPEAPSTVFARRTGDCKDKNFLLVIILRALGIKAHPALVNTRLRQTVIELHPSATVFNHVITQVDLEGQVYWLDATANYERGSLAVRSWPLYGCALVVRPGTTELTAVAPSPELPTTTVTEYIHLGQVDQESTIKVVTIAEGRDAEWLRQLFTTTARNEIERANLSYYSGYYTDIAQTRPLLYADNEQQNEIEVDEFYTVRKIWSRLPGDLFFHCRIYAANVQTAMKPPDVFARSMPLGVPYPEHQIFHAEISMAPVTVIAPDNQTIKNPAFFFQRVVTIRERKLFLDYEYRSRTDAVSPEAVPAYVRQLDSAEDLTGYTISLD
jgi:transglutaminase-like putative cysteine protease